LVQIIRNWRLALMCALLAILMSSAWTGPAAASTTTYSFNLIGPNTAMASSAPFAGDTIRVTGSGTFNTAAKTVSASGSFTHIKAEGTVFARGTWRATSFTSFTAFGGPNPGIQGGVLWITVTLFPNGGAPHPGFAMSVTCLVNAPSGFTGDEGTTVGPFTEKTGGNTLFHLTL
jgi:hypothetical protein